MASQRAGFAAAGTATNTIGAMHGEGAVTVPSKLASPALVAGVVPATRFTTLGAPTASVLWQLKIMANVGTGLAPVLTRVNPCTRTSIFPPFVSSACAETICHGAPPPAIPRMGLA